MQVIVDGHVVARRAGTSSFPSVSLSLFALLSLLHVSLADNDWINSTKLLNARLPPRFSTSRLC